MNNSKITPIEQRLLLPDEPGIYKFFNKNNVLIYVGKAKSLKKRVNNYFTSQGASNLKTKKLVKEITNIEFTLTNTEYDALLLENNLIKESQPKYNILLKDDKTFPFICILDEPFPRIISTRKYDPKNGEYFGPYTSVGAMKSVLHLLRKLYRVRTCNLKLSPKNINSKKFKICLEYHIGNCLGPCEGLQNEENYSNEIVLARNILKGNISIVKQYYQNEMTEAANNLAFERAQVLKEKLQYLDKFHSKATVVNTKLSDIDVITIKSDAKNAWVNYFQVNNGAIIITRNIEIKKRLEETDEELISHAYQYFKELTRSKNTTLLSNILLDNLPENYENYIPQIGDKKKLIELSIRNLSAYKKDKILREEPKKNAVLVQLQQDLLLKEYPTHIECFDNSNLQGSNPVASMVCFKNGKPAKKEYRKYNIKTVEGPNDFASMEEIVKRRYQRLIAENLPLPHLILIDGGKGQLSSAVTALKEINLYGQIPVIGIAKRLEEIYYPEDSIPLHIHKKSTSLKLLQQLRDEAHRFAITFHRQKRSKNTFKSEIEEIPGIGQKTIELLRKEFKSLKNISSQPIEELSKIIGDDKATKIKSYFDIK